MAVIDHFESKEEFLSFRDHVGNVMKHKNFGISLKQRNIDELAAMLAGAADFNTALGMCKPKPVFVEPEIDKEYPGLHYNTVSVFLQTTVGVSFEGAGFFERCERYSNLAGILALIYSDDNESSQNTLKSIARFAKKDNTTVSDILDDCFSRKLPYSLKVDTEQLSNWLLSQQHFILASWLDYLADVNSEKDIRDFGEYISCFGEYLYHTDTDEEVEGFLDVMGSDFTIKKVLEDKDGGEFQWFYQGITNGEIFGHRIYAIVDFLSELPELITGGSSFGKCLDPRLTHYMVIDNGNWGVAQTLKEAKLARPYEKKNALTKNALVYRCTPGSTVNENGGVTRPKEDPDAVRINPRTLKVLD